MLFLYRLAALISVRPVPPAVKIAGLSISEPLLRGAVAVVEWLLN